ncbi:MAG: LuxR C-terminal-related transcriptional regulator [Adlercreutzia equolifaciens]
MSAAVPSPSPLRSTPREAEILQFYARGRSTAVVQEELVLSYNTVKTHVESL